MIYLHRSQPWGSKYTDIAIHVERERQPNPRHGCKRFKKEKRFFTRCWLFRMKNSGQIKPEHSSLC